MKDCEIKILGSVYQVKIKKDDDRFVECDGYVDTTTNTIVIQDLVNKEHEVMDDQNMEERMMQICRHEIIHAFLHESGLDVCSHKEWAMNEEMVDWISIQIGKMIRSMYEAGCFRLIT